MVTIANLTADAAGTKNIVVDAAGTKNGIANYAPAAYNEAVTVVRDTTDRWTVAWVDGVAPFTLYNQGELQIVTEDSSYSLVSTEEPAIEVYDSTVTDTPYTLINKPYAALVWFSPEEQSYLVDKYVSPSWRRHGRPIREVRTGYYQASTGILGDALDEQWRITPLNEWEVAGTPEEHNFTVASHPAPPVYSATITGGNLVIGSA